eukprot:2231851-Rhodomonas_salina.3
MPFGPVLRRRMRTLERVWSGTETAFANSGTRLVRSCSSGSSPSTASSPSWYAPTSKPFHYALSGNSLISPSCPFVLCPNCGPDPAAGTASQYYAAFVVNDERCGANGIVRLIVGKLLGPVCVAA